MTGDASSGYDYVDNIDGKLDDYYTKDEVDASQAAQDSLQAI